MDVKGTRPIIESPQKIGQLNKAVDGHKELTVNFYVLLNQVLYTDVCICL